MNEQQIDQLIKSMPSGSDGFLKSWGLRQFAHAVERAVLQQFNKYTVDHWIDSRVPPTSEKEQHYPISVLGVIDERNLRMDDTPFVDIVSYWPALKKWTVTYVCVAQDDVTEREVRVTKWMPLPNIGD